MKALKLIGLVIAGLLFLVVLISFFLPSTFYVERSILIQSDVSVPFTLAKDFREWDKWSPWHAIDPQMQKIYSNVQGEEGSCYTWDSKNPDAGKGKVTITKIVPNERIENNLEFEGMGSSIANYLFEPAEGGVKVTWTLAGDGKGIPWYMKVPSKYFNLMMDDMLGKDYEKGLIKLKEISESAPVPDKIMGFATEQRSIETLKIASIRSIVKTNDVSSVLFGKWFGQISQALSAQNIKPTGYPMTIYHKYDPKEVELEAAIQVTSLGKKENQVSFREMAAIKALIVKYYGNYNNMETFYNATYDYIQSKGMSSNGSPMEIYVTDPGLEKDTAKWLTEVVFPLD